MTAKRVTIAVAVAIAGLLLASEGLAQNAPFAALPGLTETQRATAAGIQSVCERLAPINAQLTGGAADLFQRCREMVQNSNELQGIGPTGFSLGLSTAGLAGAVSAIAPDEAAAAGTLATEPGGRQFRLLAPRLSALRGGGGGLSMNLNVNGKRLAAVSSDVLTDVGGSASPDLGRSSRLGVFLNGNVAFGDRDTTDREAGFDFYSVGVLGGADYRLTDNLILGAALNFTFADADYDQFLGDVDAYSYGALLYGTYYQGPAYVDAHAGFNWNEYDITRRVAFPTIDRTATADTDGRQYSMGAGAGYDLRRGPVTVTPFGRVEYIRLDIDGYSERGAAGLDLAIRDQTVESFQTALGVTMSYAWSVPFGVLVPQIRGEWRHEFLNDERSITATYVNDPFNTFFAIPTEQPDRDFFALGAGLSAALAQGFTAFVNYETIVGLRDVTYHEFWVGVRKEF